MVSALDLRQVERRKTISLLYFSKSKEHTVPLFLKSNCLPLPSLFFRDCSHLLYDINKQTAPVSILNQFVKTSQIHNYRPDLSLATFLKNVIVRFIR